MEQEVAGASKRVPQDRNKGSLIFWAVFAGLFLIQILPFLMTQTPALLDYPNHLARIFALNSLRSDSFLQQYYQPNWNVLPNLAFDGLGLLLSQALPIYLAGQVALLAAVLLMASGLAALSAALHGKANPFCLLGFLFIFSHPFTYGFVSLILGFGLVLWGIAIWLRLRGRPLPIILAWSVPFASLLFFAHLFAFAAYGVTLACIELILLRSAERPLAGFRRAVLLGAAQVAVPAALFLFASPTPLGSSGTAYTGGLLRRLRSMALSPVRNYDDAVDLFTFGVVAALLALGFWTRRLQVVKEMRLALVVLALLCLVMPNTLSTSSNAEIRLPVILSLLLAASGAWKAPGRRAMQAAAALLVLLLSVRTWVTMDAFAQGDRFVKDMKGALATVPRGSRIASVTVTTPSEHRMRPEWQHSICYEVIEKSALVPTVFAFPEQQPLLFRESVRSQEFPPDHYVSRPGMPLPATMFQQLDYLVLINPEALQTQLPENLQIISRWTGFQVYRLRQGAGPAKQP